MSNCKANIKSLRSSSVSVSPDNIAENFGFLSQTADDIFQFLGGLSGLFNSVSER